MHRLVAKSCLSKRLILTYRIAFRPSLGNFDDLSGTQAEAKAVGPEHRERQERQANERRDRGGCE
jgi:hypothetical protein